MQHIGDRSHPTESNGFESGQIAQCGCPVCPVVERRCYADDAGVNFEWADWKPRPFDETIIYEMHVGSFTPEGTLKVTIADLSPLFLVVAGVAEHSSSRSECHRCDG